MRGGDHYDRGSRVWGRMITYFDKPLCSGNDLIHFRPLFASVLTFILSTTKILIYYFAILWLGSQVLRREERQDADYLLSRPIYLDYQAGTPCREEVLDEMMPYFQEKHGNPHSTTHVYGWEAETALENARKEFADVIGATPREIVFTSGATESNNIAIRGGVFASREANEKGRSSCVITCKTEHKSVLESCDALASDGFSVIYLPVETSGRISLAELDDALSRNKAILVSIMAVNNEIGVIQPIEEIGKICRAHGVLFHTDAAQALGRIPLDVARLSVDFMSFSGHKIYGPKGIGALYVRRGVRVRPLLAGGGQERGVRPGTVAVPLCVGLAKAASLAEAERESEHTRLLALRDRFLARLSVLDRVLVNGDLTHRVPANLNLCFEGVESEAVILGVKDVIAISSSSACSSAQLEPSYVICALGTSPDLVNSSLRISLGLYTTDDDVDRAADSLIDAVTRLRVISPIWGARSSGT